MKHLGKLAVLGAVLAASAPFASAIPIAVTGAVNTSGGSTVSSPAVFTANATTFNLGGTLFNPGAITPPPASGSIATILAVGADTVTDFNFSSAGIIAGGSAGQEILSIAVAGGDTITFFATGWNSLVASTPSSEGAVNLTGYITESQSGTYLSPQNNVVLDFAANGINNNFTEDLVATTPEPNSLILLGTGLFGAAGMLVRRRRIV